MFQLQMAFPSKAIYFKLCCPSSPFTKIFQKNRNSIRACCLSCCLLFLVQKDTVWPDLPKNANVESFPLFEEF